MPKIETYSPSDPIVQEHLARVVPSQELFDQVVDANSSEFRMEVGEPDIEEFKRFVAEEREQGRATLTEYMGRATQDRLLNNVYMRRALTTMLLDVVNRNVMLDDAFLTLSVFMFEVGVRCGREMVNAVDEIDRLMRMMEEKRDETGAGTGTGTGQS